MQFLIDDPTDITAIPYIEKLRAFLSDVFWGDELSEKIRDAFDAYVVMSYRKKDRKMAQSLMHLIHEDDFCRDVAIWYDEFLIPGEDFSQSIVEAIEKSDLFALVVTPNLIIEDNYVLQKEYPLAVEKKKSVMPVEMLDTDKSKLSELYSGITASVSHNDKEVIHKWIRGIIPEAIRAKQDKEPSHSFFMGLTYLAGVDVEIDRDRALQLIESAANAGLDEAIEKLVSMYTYGDGVAQSLEKAIGWQDKLVGKYVDLSEDSMKEENIIVFLRNNMYFGKLAYDAKMYDKAERTYETSYNVGKMMAFGAVGKNIFSKISNFIKKYSGRNEYFTESYYYFLQSLRMCLLIQDEMGYGLGRDEWLKKAMLFGSASSLAYDDPKILKESCMIFGKLGELCLESGNMQGAEHWFQKETEVGQAIDEDNALQNGALKGSISYHDAILYDRYREYDKAVVQYEDAIQVLGSLYEEFQDIYVLLKLAEM